MQRKQKLVKNNNGAILLKIDDKGRLLIPKFIRKTFDFEQCSEVQAYISTDGIFITKCV